MCGMANLPGDRKTRYTEQPFQAKDKGFSRARQGARKRGDSARPNPDGRWLSRWRPRPRRGSADRCAGELWSVTARLPYRLDIRKISLFPRLRCARPNCASCRRRSRRHVLTELGCEVAEAAPDFADAEEIFQVWRAWRFELRYSELLEAHRDRIKDTVIWNTEKGQRLTGPELGRAEVRRTQLYHRMRAFMERYEFLLCATNQVPPFDVAMPYLTEIDGVKMETYIDWMRSCWHITITGHPAISVPCGFTPEGLPVGLQIVGRHQDDFGVLQLAHAFEQATGAWKRRPPIAA
ncbi:MAG: hypothetical protein IIA40_11555 [SAR324 cluster bacterium]|nr:hypothetical protein [SAR324 cluster bacterium]